MAFESRENCNLVKYLDCIHISNKQSSSDSLPQFAEDGTNFSDNFPTTISAQEMEEIILIHPAIKTAVVVRSTMGQFRAFVVLNRGYEDESSDVIRSFVDDQVQPQNQLKGGLYVIPNLLWNIRRDEAFKTNYSSQMSPHKNELSAPAVAA